MSNFAAMNRPGKYDKWVVTALSRLSGRREWITPVLPKAEAERRLERYRKAARGRGFHPYILARLERAIARQLELNFTN